MRHSRVRIHRDRPLWWRAENTAICYLRPDMVSHEALKAMLPHPYWGKSCASSPSTSSTRPTCHRASLCEKDGVTGKPLYFILFLYGGPRSCSARCVRPEQETYKLTHVHVHAYAYAYIVLIVILLCVLSIYIYICIYIYMSVYTYVCVYARMHPRVS